MEPENTIQETPAAPQKSTWTTVTPLSKYLAMALFVALPFIGGFVGYQYALVKVKEVDNWALPIEKNENTHGFETELLAQGDQVPIETNIPNEYSSSSYRVVSLIHNPYYPKESEFDSVVFLFSREVSDYRCGQKSRKEDCYYIFLQYGGSQPPKFVAAWNEGRISQPEAIKFISPREILIDVADGDGCVAFKGQWKVDVTTGSSTEVFFEDLSRC